MNSVKKNKNGKNTKTKSKGYAAYKCDLCPKEFNSKYYLATHRKLHSNEKPFQCSLCDYAGKTVKYLTKHIRVTHTRERKWGCDICGKSFEYDCILKKHMRVHTGEKPYECGDCGKAFNSSYSFRTHKLIHSNLKPFKCTFCPYACRDSSTLRKHKERHMGKIKYFTCSVCNKSFSKKTTLKIHIAETHFEIDMRRMECDACGKRFKQRNTLISHIQTVHEKSRTVKCDICGKTLCNGGNLRTHMRTHVDQRPFICTFKGCGKTYKDASTLGKHSIVHYPERQFPCKICDKLFAREHRMRDHLRTHMAKVKKFECDHCGVRFYNKTYLSTHIHRKHGRKKQKYVCDLCGLVTSNKPSIVMHLKYGHGGHKKLACRICKKRFKRHLTLNLHYWTVHKKENVKKEMSKKTDETEVEVKQEPIDHAYDGGVYFEVSPKIEPLDDEGIEELTNIVPEPEPQNEYEDIPNAVLEEFIAPAQEGHQNRNLKYDGIEEPSNIVPEPEPRNEFEDIPDSVLEEFITPVHKGHQNRQAKHPKDCYLNEKLEKRIQIKIDVLMEERRKREEERDRKMREKKKKRELKKARRALERTRRKYNRLIRNAVQNSLKKDKIKIKHGAISAQEQQPNSLLEENFFIQQIIDNRDRAIDEAVIDAMAEKNKDKTEDRDIDNNSLLQEVGDKNEENGIGNEDEENVDKNDEDEIEHHEKEGQDGDNVTSSGDEKNEKEGKSVLGRNRKLKFNTHQCYVCFKLYQTKEELLDHCKEHFNVTNMQTLKKCPICDYTTNLSITTHLKRKHKIKVKVPYGSFKDNKQSDGSRYYYEVNDKRIKKVEIIPSVKNLNKRASCKIDKRNREKKNKDVLKRKLVKKGEEWIVMQEKIKINFNDCLLPKFDKLVGANVKASYVDNLKELYKEAKKNGKKMLFPCESCDKICQTLAALKLHSRKHEANPKPFKPKVWKHKIKGKKIDKNKTTAATINKDNRTAKPKPVVNKHKCDKELIEFYEQNIKGADIEFWQFLKIYNKMERENINDFEDLQKSSVFGLHNNEPVANNLNEDCNLSKENTENTANDDLRIENRSNNVSNITDKKGSEHTARNAFTRVVRLSKKELMKRNEARKRLREKIKCNSGNTL